MAVTEESTPTEELTDLQYIGPATASTLETESVSPADVREKRVSYQMLVDAGINAGVATKIRRWHSLPWTYDSEEHHLDRRSQTVRHLQDDEREWVAASSDWREEDVDADESALTDSDWSEDASSTEDDDSDEERPTLTAGDWGPVDSEGTTADDESPRTAGDWEPGNGATTETDGSGAAEAKEAAWREESRPDPVTAIPELDEDIAATLVDASVTTARRLATSDPVHVGKVLDLPTERVREWIEAADEHVHD
jgi:hypothetical protein